MRSDLLLKLADGLENYVKDEWWTYTYTFTDGFDKQKCGSLACAIGWSVPLMGDPRLQFSKNGYLQLDGEDTWDIDIMSKYYNIPINDANAIFSEAKTYDKYWNDVTRLDVAAKIREYVASDGKLFENT